MRISQIAARLGGTFLGPDKEISCVSTLEEAGEHAITFLANVKYREKALATQAGAIIVKEALPLGQDLSQILVADPYVAFAEAVNLLHPPKAHKPGIAPQAYVHADASVDGGACVYPQVYIGAGASIAAGVVLHPGCKIGDGVHIGADSVLYPNVVVYDGCRIGARCIIHAGVVIGSDGFGFAWDGVRHQKIRQVGIVVIGDEVEIGSNCAIDRAALSATVIGADVKMDNMVHIAHNVTIGDHSIIVAQTGIAGSAKIGRHVVLAGQCGVGGHISVGDGTVAASRTGIVANVGAGKVVSGYPAIDHKQWLRVQKIYKELPELARRVRHLEKNHATED